MQKQTAVQKQNQDPSKRNYTGQDTSKRKYTGPPKGSDEARALMERVRAAQWAKNGLK